MPEKEEIVCDNSVMNALYNTDRHKSSSAWDTSSLSSCATTVIGDDRIVDVSSCSISIASNASSTPMSQTSSRPPSEVMNKAYWFACAPKQAAALTGMGGLADEDDCNEQSTNTTPDNNKCFCTDSCPNLKEQREQQFLNNNNHTIPDNRADNPFMVSKTQNFNNKENYNSVTVYPIHTTSASNPTTPLSDTYWFAHTGVEPVVAMSTDTDGRDGLKFEEKLRICRERQDEDRQRRLLEIELSSQQKNRYRQQLEEDRRRKIDELKVKDLEKRNAVEERKRLIWEAEQERKEAMVRRSLERDNKLETKRLTQRNASGFVFGSSTPRTIDLDMPALGSNRSQTIVFATPNRMTNSDENSKRRPISAYYSDDFNISNNDKTTTDSTANTTSPLSIGITPRDSYKYRSALYSEQARACLTMYDNSGHDFSPINGTISSAADENLMSQSLVSLHGVARGRKRHTELTPALPRERIFASSTGRINKDLNRSVISESVKSTPKRAVSMTRLDQLAQPRRRFLESDIKSNNSQLSGNNNTNNSLTDCLSAKSMCNLNITNNNKHQNRNPSPSRPSPLRKGNFKSMTHLSANNQTITTKIFPNNNNQFNNKTPNYSQFCKQNKEKSKSMVQLSARPPPPPPRQTRASKLRSQNSTLRNARSSLTLNIDFNSRENTLSPTRPMSSMSGSTDSTQEVKRRVKPTVPRKPRPISIGSPYTEKKVENKENTQSVGTNRAGRALEKQTPIPPMRPNRTRSAGASPRPLSLASPDMETNSVAPKPMPPRKPAHVKAAALARKATKQAEPANTSDQNNSSVSNNNKISSEVVVSTTTDEQSVPSVEPKPVEPKPVEPAVSVSPTLGNSDTGMPSNANNKKDISEDDYKKVLAEKRKLAREQAEREAEAERLRLEKEELEEQERVRREEEEQRKLEEEQLRLIELQKRAEEERLQKAMEENRLREEEENKRRVEEQRLRLEKEEKDKKAKEETERQRLELEERLKRDEEERLQRKKKLEAIMSRTRKTPTARGQSPSNSPNETPEPQLTDNSNGSTPEKTREVTKNHQNMLKNEQKNDDLVIITKSDMNSVANNHSKPDLVEDVNRAVLQNRKEQNNGVSALNGSSRISNNNNNHIESFRADQRLDASDNLLDFSGISSVTARPAHEVNASLDQLINLNFSAQNRDDVNSNHVSNAYIPTNGATIKSQEQTITDLLS